MLWLGLAVVLAFQRHSLDLHNLIDNLRKVHQTDHLHLKQIYSTTFSEGYQLCKTVIDILLVLCCAASLLYIALGIVFSYFVLGQEYPLPTMYEIYFCPANNTVNYFINMAALVIFLLAGNINCIFGGCLVFYSLIMGSALITTTAEAANTMNDEILNEIGFDEWAKIVMEGINTSKEYGCQK